MMQLNLPLKHRVPKEFKVFVFARNKFKMTAKSEQQPKDCLACRLISGFGLIGIGLYIYSQSKGRGQVEVNVMKVVSTCAAGLGVARLLNMGFHKASKRDRNFKN